MKYSFLPSRTLVLLMSPFWVAFGVFILTHAKGFPIFVKVFYAAVFIVGGAWAFVLGVLRLTGGWGRKDT